MVSRKTNRAVDQIPPMHTGLYRESCHVHNSCGDLSPISIAPESRMRFSLHLSVAYAPLLSDMLRNCIIFAVSDCSFNSVWQLHWLFEPLFYSFFSLISQKNIISFLLLSFVKIKGAKKSQLAAKLYLVN